MFPSLDQPIPFNTILGTVAGVFPRLGSNASVLHEDLHLVEDILRDLDLERFDLADLSVGWKVTKRHVVERTKSPGSWFGPEVRKLQLGKLESTSIRKEQQKNEKGLAEHSSWVECRTDRSQTTR